ncbi:DNA-directed RNA polymerase subunit beta [Planococcus liqunii]|uniref:DNA-directed RNA polymerase subunit beta n=1 Tax=Planococcus liqunii TaxID=3058394 RepID=A0ABT8MNN2_9BACL|nr:MULTISPECIES: DNA-directed RNA polymerase subunit beta [unclassified Planococcus (in: firmicutes)]MDN7226507.1 DNA-directed RNA polymerase subunit beta [Planococcus sp. N064]WKA50287.1 DNA-directed RNA polymerase subunit beta [Planococcus sp. N056]
MVDTKKKFNFRQQTKRETTQKAEPKKRGWVQIRLFPIWLRIILVIVMIALAAVLGVMVGYGIIGDGKPSDALKWETWQHIIDIMSGKK